jgi:hypothetical protein
MMLAECSGVGVAIDVTKVPKPDGVPLERWLQTFPSFGYLLAVAPANLAEVLAQFAARGIAAADIGAVSADRRVQIADATATEAVWDFTREPLMGCARAEVVA